MKENIEITAKRTAKNSVFLDLFQNKDYLLQLYKAIHPEDKNVTKESLTNITIENVLTDNLYNDLSFIVNDKLMILAEAQSTWTTNILIRILLYLAQNFHEFLLKTEQNYYSSRKVNIPKPEIYLIYTGERGRKPDIITFSNEFFNGNNIDVEIKAHVIYETNSSDIINQYIIFCKNFNEQIKINGMTLRAIEETIRICKDIDVLYEYLSKREKEVITIMKSLFDQEEIIKMYGKGERHDAEMQAASRMIKSGKLTLDEISSFLPSLSATELKKLKSEVK